jgi:hypothetical protein
VRDISGPDDEVARSCVDSLLADLKGDLSAGDKECLVFARPCTGERTGGKRPAPRDRPRRAREHDCKQRSTARSKARVSVTVRLASEGVLTSLEVL